jgi:hypothetical protein
LRPQNSLASGLFHELIGKMKKGNPQKMKYLPQPDEIHKIRLLPLGLNEIFIDLMGNFGNSIG